MMIRLGNVVDVSAGQAAPPSDAFTNSGIPFVRAGSVDGLMSTGNWERLEKLDERAAKAHKMKLFPANTVVFAKSGMSAALARIFKTDRPAYIVSHLAALKPNGNADPSFLAHWLEYYGTDKLIKDPAYPSIRLSDIEEMPFPKLALLEQRRIAGILDQANALRRLRCHSLSRLSDLGQAIFYEMFGEYFGGEARGRTDLLGNFCNIQVGFPFKSGSYTESPESIMLCRGANVLPSRLDWSDMARYPIDLAKPHMDFALQQDDVVIAMDRGIL